MFTERLRKLLIAIFAIFSLAITNEHSKVNTSDHLNNQCDPKTSGTTALNEIIRRVHRGPDLSEELLGKNQSGGRIVIVKDENGKIKVIRKEHPRLSATEEMTQREEIFELFKKINIIKESDLNGNESVPQEKVMSLLHQFALSDVGAIWLRRVTDDTIAAINRGYLEVDASKKTLSSLVTGKLTDDAVFDANFVVFKIFSFLGNGATGGGSRISIGENLFKDTFPSSGQKIDPLAIISHEFGHTLYGDPTSGENIHGEARCVEHFENPARVHHHYDERLTYCDPKTNTVIDIKTKIVTKKDCSKKT